MAHTIALVHLWLLALPSEATLKCNLLLHETLSVLVVILFVSLPINRLFRLQECMTSGRFCYQLKGLRRRASTNVIGKAIRPKPQKEHTVKTKPRFNPLASYSSAIAFRSTAIFFGEKLYTYKIVKKLK